MSSKVNIDTVRKNPDSARAYTWNLSIKVGGFDSDLTNLRAVSSNTPQIDWADIAIDFKGNTVHERGLPTIGTWDFEIIDVKNYAIYKALKEICYRYADPSTTLQESKADVEGGGTIIMEDLNHQIQGTWTLTGVLFQSLPAIAFDSSKDGTVTIALSATIDKVDFS